MNELRPILEKESVQILFRPVVSVRKKELVGLRAVGRGVDGDGKPVPFETLRAQAQEASATLDLDRLLRRKALDAFGALPETGDLLLFLNVDTSILDLGVVGSGLFRKMVESSNSDPSRVVIEFAESGVNDTEALRKFVETYRREGYLIALNDLGTGHSNLSRLTIARPDIVKIAPSLTEGIERDYYRREIVSSLTAVSKKLGALVAAMGSTRLEECVAELELGVDMLEEPVLLDTEGLARYRASALSARMDELSRALKDVQVSKTRAEKDRRRVAEKAVSELVQQLSAVGPEEFEPRLSGTLAQASPFECLYVLDENGVQITGTITVPGRPFKRSTLFRPAERGADHSSKEYFFLLNDTFVTRYTTEPYVSLASGNLCVTISGLFRDSKGREHTLCADVPVE